MGGNVNKADSVWQMAGGNAGRTGLFPRISAVEAVPVRRLRAEGAIHASVVFDTEDQAMTADLAGGVSCFSARGESRWRAKVAGGISASPANGGIERRLFLGTHAGRVYALDSDTGSTVWQRTLPTRSDPRIVYDLLYLARAKSVVASNWGGRFYALDAETGAVRFSWEAGVSPRSGAAADAEETVYCLRARVGQGIELVEVKSDGKERVLHRAAEGEQGARRALVAAAPVVDRERGVVYFIINQGKEGTLHAWSVARGNELWTTSLPHAVQATPAIRHDGLVVIADLGGWVHAIGPRGVARYHYRTRCEYLLAGGVCDAAGTFYIGDPLGVVHEVGAGGQGQQLAELPRSIQAQPSFDTTGNLFVPVTDRQVYVFPRRG